MSNRDAGGEWFAERIDLMHDLWHVLTGYGTDGGGEAALLPLIAETGSGLVEPDLQRSRAALARVRGR